MGFTSIKGNQQAVEILRRYIQDGRMQGGYLFCGPQGVGKKMTALVLAKALNCASLTGDSCDRCPSCLKTDTGNHPDVHIISKADDDIKIEDIRSFQREMGLRSYEGRVKVFIIDNAHLMTPEASNALLKILEEPPANSVLILITDKLSLMLKTVLSRCRTIKFTPLERLRLENLLRVDYSVDTQTAHCIAFISEGRIGRALYLKESDFLTEKNRVITGFLEPEKAGDLDGADRDQMRRYLMILATWLRDIYLCQAGMMPEEFIHSDRSSQIQSAAKESSPEKAYNLLSAVASALRDLDGNVNTKLLMYSVREELRCAMQH
jgi:DNA polymerase III subunit delta'